MSITFRVKSYLVEPWFLEPHGPVRCRSLAGTGSELMRTVSRPLLDSQVKNDGEEKPNAHHYANNVLQKRVQNSSLELKKESRNDNQRFPRRKDWSSSSCGGIGRQRNEAKSWSSSDWEIYYRYSKPPHPDLSKNPPTSPFGQNTNYRTYSEGSRVRCIQFPRIGFGHFRVKEHPRGQEYGDVGYDGSWVSVKEYILLLVDNRYVSWPELWSRD